MSLTWRQALKKTVEEFQIPQTDLTDKSGVSESSVSRYLKGTNDLSSERVQKIINSLPDEAKEFFFALLNPEGMNNMTQDAVSPHTALIAYLEAHLHRCSQEQFMDVLHIVIHARESFEAGDFTLNANEAPHRQ